MPPWARIEAGSWDSPWSDAADVIDPEFDASFAAMQAELVRRLEAEPGVSDVILTLGPAGEESSASVEIEGVHTSAGTTQAVREGSTGHWVGSGRVAIGFFDAFDVPLLAGRLFQRADTTAGATAVVVNRSFVQNILHGGNALGRRVRYVGGDDELDWVESEARAWHEIVGVVEDFPKPVEPDRAVAKVYHAAGPNVARHMINIRVRGGDPAMFASRLRDVAASLDPRLQLREVLPLDTVLREEQRGMKLAALGIALVMCSVLLLSAAGLYALMSFAVTRRRREIGIRAALGAHPHRILAAIFSRAMAQLAVGVIAGLLLSAWIDVVTDGALIGGQRTVLLLAVSGYMMAVGLLAALGPARRGLRIQPTEVLREE